MNDLNLLCGQFARILHGESKLRQGGCSVALKRNIPVLVQGKPSASVMSADVLFESLDRNGNALNLAEIALLQEEVPAFTHSAAQQGMIVSALHNHWLYTEPSILYLHLQSVEPPLTFAAKVAQAFRTLRVPPVAADG